MGEDAEICPYREEREGGGQGNETSCDIFSSHIMEELARGDGSNFVVGRCLRILRGWPSWTGCPLRVRAGAGA